MIVFHYNDEEKGLHAFLEERGHENVVVGAQGDPFEVARNQVFDAAFIGLHPHGLQLIRQLHRTNRDCLVTMVTADRNTRIAVEAMKLGAFDYLLTPLDLAEVERTLIMMMREYEGQREREGLENQLNDQQPSAIAVAHEPGGLVVNGNGFSGKTMAEIINGVEAIAIRHALDRSGGNIARAARELDISRTTLYAKLKQIESS